MTFPIDINPLLEAEWCMVIELDTYADPGYIGYIGPFTSIHDAKDYAETRLNNYAVIQLDDPYAGEWVER